MMLQLESNLNYYKQMLNRYKIIKLLLIKNLIYSKTPFHKPNIKQNILKDNFSNTLKVKQREDK